MGPYVVATKCSATHVIRRMRGFYPPKATQSEYVMIAPLEVAVRKDIKVKSVMTAIIYMSALVRIVGSVPQLVIYCGKNVI